MANADAFYLTLLQHKEWARNGSVPHHAFARRVLETMNHVSKNRRKTVAQWSTTPNDEDQPRSGFNRGYFRTGHAATHVVFVLYVGCTGSADGSAGYTASLTEVGGATQSRTGHMSSIVGTGNLGPTDNSTSITPFAVSPNTEYTWSVEVTMSARIRGGLIHERATDETLDYFSDSRPSADHPINDSLREEMLVGLSETWKKNGSHLLSWPSHRNPPFTSTTWTNVLDDATTAPGATTPGFYLSDLQQHCRLSEPTTLRVKLCAYGDCAGGSTGEIRLEDSTGTRCSLTGIGATTQWYTTTTTIANVDTMTKVDLQARVAAGGSTFTLHSVDLWTYVA